MEATHLFGNTGLSRHSSDGGASDELFARIADNLLVQGYSVNPLALPIELAAELQQHLCVLSAEKFKAAGVGRESEHMRNRFVRSDEICWITGESEVGRQWLAWAEQLQTYLNRRLLLGLFSFESHFAHYSPGDYYKRHLDSFKGAANRVLSVVAYLNNTWLPDEGGELVLYKDERDLVGLKVTPAFGTLVVFLSEEFPHEVLPATRDRYSIAGWYRVNSSTSDRSDPPR
ncbi:2OG-Fe(II) oxygenase [Teredinibacter waterburyi]|uniref:2OG-Fe(II) oxygenase n=1 Tax=Teredinibacter waterburyi TaxID=1500538 RepID=UPI00165FEB05|nr:2OG-Fe(II) oxygenase [Teredinibacter waterburyi]